MASRKPAPERVLSHAAACAAVDAWNAAHPIGTPVVVTLDDGSEIETTTRSRAGLIADRIPVVAVAGKYGNFVLSRVRAK